MNFCASNGDAMSTQSIYLRPTLYIFAFYFGNDEEIHDINLDTFIKTLNTIFRFIPFLRLIISLYSINDFAWF